MTMLDLKVGNEAVLLSRISKVIALAEDTRATMDREYSAHASSTKYWFDRASSFFSSMNLNGDWELFANKMDSQAMSNLHFAVDLLVIRTVKAPTDDVVSEWREKINELLSEILKSDASTSIRTPLVRYLQRIIIALDEYKICGTMPVVDAIATTLGRAGIDAQYNEEIQKTSLGKRVLSLLEGVSKAVAVAHALPDAYASVMAFYGMLRHETPSLPRPTSPDSTAT